MAYAKKYELPFKSQDGDEYRIDIYLEGFGGASTELTGFNPTCVIKYPRAKHLWQPIRSSEMLVQLNSDTDFKFSEFFDAAYGDYRADLVNTTSSTTIWTGYNVADIYSEPYIAPPYPIKLKFTDGLKEMKNIEFKDGASLYAEQMHLIQAIRICLNNLGTPLNIYEAFNVYEDDQTTGAAQSSMVQTFVDTGVYRKVLQGFTKGMTCFEVLENILGSIGCFISQKEGAWWIVRSRELVTGNLTWRRFTPSAGSESSTTVDANGTTNPLETIVNPSSRTASNEIVVLNTNPHLDFAPKFRRVVYKYEPLKWNFASSLLLNATFLPELGVNDDNLPAFWSRVGLSQEKCQAAEIDGNIWMALLGTAGDAINSAQYVENVADNIFVQSTDVISFSAGYQYIFENRDVNTDGIYNVAIRARLTESSSGDIYELTNTGWVLFTGSYSIVNALCTPEGDKVTFGEDSPPFTGAAKLEFRIHGVFPFIGSGSDQALIAFDSFAGHYRDSAGSGLETLVCEVEEIDSINTDVTHEIDAFHGDGPDYSSNGSFRNSDDSVTDSWERLLTNPGESKGIHEILIADVLDMRSDYARRLSITLRGSEELYIISRIRHTLSAVNYDFIPLGLDWSVQENRYTLQLIEVNNFSYSSTATSGGSLGGGKGGGTSPGGGPSAKVAVGPTGKTFTGSTPTSYPS